MSDRFEEMRSKGTNTNDADAVASDIAMGKTAYVKGKKITGTSSGGGGGDYSAIGTTVTVEAQGTIAKGARWEGVKNGDYTTTFTTQNIASNGAYYFSEDLAIGIGKGPYSASSTSFIVYFWDKQNSLYVQKQIDISTVASKITSSVNITPVLSHDGSLVMLRFYNYPNNLLEFIFIEIDRYTETCTPYFAQLENIPQTSSKAGKVAFFGNKYLVTTNADYNLEFYKYSTSTHTLQFINALSTGVSRVAWLFAPETQWINPAENIWISWSASTIASSSGAIYAVKFALVDGEFQFSYNIIENASGTLHFSSDGNYLAYKNSSNVFCPCSLNIQDLTITLLTTKSSSIYYTFFIEGTKVLEQFSTTPSSKIYEMSPTGALTKICSLSGYDFTPTRTFNMLNLKKFIALSTDTIGSIEQDSEAEYIVTPNLTGATEEGKYYGVASQAMNIGDVGEAQLLFTT